MGRHWIAVAAALGVTGCAGAPWPQAQAVPPPANYRAAVAAHVKATFVDPYSIRDASISAPIAGTSLMGPVWTVCMRANAKNRLGAYAGLKETSFTFRDGQIMADDQYAAITCAAAAYEPFAEVR